MPGYCPVIIHGFPFPWKNHCLKPQKIWGLMRAVDCPEGMTTWLKSSLLHLTRIWLAALYSLSLFLFLPESCLILGKRFPKLFLYFSCWGTVSFFLIFLQKQPQVHHLTQKSDATIRNMGDTQFRLKAAQPRKDTHSAKQTINFLWSRKRKGGHWYLLTLMISLSFSHSFLDKAAENV